MPAFPRQDFHVDADIEKALTLPAAAFTDPAFLDLELKTLFRTAWQAVPCRSALDLRSDNRSHSEILARRSARVPISLLDRPLFLQRDWKGGLHCFPNVCTHAWHTLVEGAGRERTITCPQHGRQFDTAGKFLAQPGFRKEMKGFPRACDHLEDFPVVARDPLLHVCLGKPAMPFDDLMRPVDDSIAKLTVADYRRAPHDAEVREIDGNWKQHAWNYMDKFHVAFIHRAPGGLADAIDLASYQTELHPGAALQWAYAKDPAHGFDPKLLPARFDGGKRSVFALWWFIFPNLTLNYYPWGLSTNIYMPVPGRPDRTLFLWYHFVADSRKHSKRDEVWLSEQVDREDLDAIAQVLRGVKSGFAPRGRFAPIEETGPHWYHRSISEAVFAQGD